MKKIIPKIFLAILSFTLVFYFVLFGFNIYLKVTGNGKKPEAIAWILDATIFSPDITFWSKSWCKGSQKLCKFPEEKLLSLPVGQYGIGSKKKSQECVKILFLGDSFTTAPWVSAEESYTSVFSNHFSETYHVCVKSYGLATAGANNSQELLAFSQRVARLKPDIVFWQFYWNDIPENSKEEIITVSNGQLKHRMSWTNMLFLAGFLNQRVPLLRNSTLGNHLMYLGEQKDPFSFWSFDFTDINRSIPYNQELVPKLLNEMDKLSHTHDFTWFTTIAPLECQFIPEQPNCGYESDMQDELRNMLQSDSKFVSMESQRSYSSADSRAQNVSIIKGVQNVKLFNTVEDKTGVGARHLSKEGNKLFGENLFNNYVYFNQRNFSRESNNLY